MTDATELKALYAKRDPSKQGKAYTAHVMAMTDEGLHSKTAIAAELAHRDLRIAELEQQKEILGKSADERAVAIKKLEQDLALNEETLGEFNVNELRLTKERDALRRQLADCRSTTGILRVEVENRRLSNVNTLLIKERDALREQLQAARDALEHLEEILVGYGKADALMVVRKALAAGQEES